MSFLAGILGGCVAIGGIALVGLVSTSSSDQKKVDAAIQHQIGVIEQQNRSNIATFNSYLSSKIIEQNEVEQYDFPGTFVRLDTCPVFKCHKLNSKKSKNKESFDMIEAVMSYLYTYTNDQKIKEYIEKLEKLTEHDNADLLLDAIKNYLGQNCFTIQYTNGYKDFINKYKQKNTPHDTLSKAQSTLNEACLKFLYTLGVFDSNKDKPKPLENLRENLLYKYIDNIVTRNDPQATLQLNPDDETKKLLSYLFVFPENNYKGENNNKILKSKSITLDGKRIVYNLDYAIVVKNNLGLKSGYLHKQDCSIGVIKTDIAKGEYYMYDPSIKDDKFNVYKTDDLQKFFPSYDVVKPVFLVYKLANITE